MNKMRSLWYILGVLLGAAILNGILKWLNLPTYDQILQIVLGEPTVINGVLALIITGVLIYLLIFGTVKNREN